jgi:hypothetical protein
MAVLSFPSTLDSSALAPVARVIEAGGVVHKRSETGGRVEGGSGVAEKGECPTGRVLKASSVVQKRRHVDSRVLGSVTRTLVSDIEKQRPSADSGVEAAVRVAKERIPANCGVSHTCGQVLKGISSFRRVEAGVTAIRRRINPGNFRSGQKQMRGEYEHIEKQYGWLLSWGNGFMNVPFVLPVVDPATARSEKEKKTSGENSLLAYS